MRKFDFIIVGNSIASMVSAIELGSKFKIAIINPSTKWGAYFAGFEFNGERYDAGMNLLEFSSGRDMESNILTYDPEIRYDFTRFLSQIEEYMTSKIHCVEVDLVKMFARNVYTNDIIMANSLEIFDSLSEELRSIIEQELLGIIQNNEKSLHASQKHSDNELFLNSSFFSVSIANHGKTFHELFIEPLCKKIFNVTSHDFPALFHRLIWLPLYYPETLLDAIRGNVNLVKAKFHYPSEGHFAAIVDSLYEKILSQGNISVLDEDIIDVSYQKSFLINTSKGELESAKLVWGSDLSRLVKLFNFSLNEVGFDKASLTLAFCRIKSCDVTKKFSVLYNLDDSSLLYRITNQESCAGISNSVYDRIVVEFNSDLLDEMGLGDNHSILREINEFLLSNEFIEHPISSENFIVRTMRNAVNLPSKANMDKFNTLRDYISSNAKEVELIGSASSFYSASFNDQIIQGLKIGKKYL